MLLPESVEGGGANLVLVATTLQSKYTAFNVMWAASIGQGCTGVSDFSLCKILLSKL